MFYVCLLRRGNGLGGTAACPSFRNAFSFYICLMKRLATATAQPTHSSLAPARGGDARHARRMQSRLRERELHNRQTQLLPHNGAAARTDHHSCRDNRPNTAGGQVTRPKVTCQMLNDTERMLLKAPNRHKSMLSAGRPTPLLFAPHTLCRMRPRHSIAMHCRSTALTHAVVVRRSDLPNGELTTVGPIGRTPAAARLRGTARDFSSRRLQRFRDASSSCKHHTHPTLVHSLCTHPPTHPPPLGLH